MNNNDFEIQWQRRQQALKNAENSVPDDDIILGMAKKTQHQFRIRKHWISYAAAACLLLGVILYGLYMPNTETNDKITFLCNSGCSAQDVIISANKIINQ